MTEVYTICMNCGKQSLVVLLDCIEPLFKCPKCGYRGLEEIEQ